MPRGKVALSQYLGWPSLRPMLSLRSPGHPLQNQNRSSHSSASGRPAGTCQLSAPRCAWYANGTGTPRAPATATAAGRWLQ